MTAARDCGTRLSVRGGVAVCQPPVHRWQAAGRAESPTVGPQPRRGSDSDPRRGRRLDLAIYRIVRYCASRPLLLKLLSSVSKLVSESDAAWAVQNRKMEDLDFNAHILQLYTRCLSLIASRMLSACYHCSDLHLKGNRSVMNGFLPFTEVTRSQLSYSLDRELFTASIRCSPFNTSLDRHYQTPHHVGTHHRVTV